MVQRVLLLAFQARGLTLRLKFWLLANVAESRLSMVVLMSGLRLLRFTRCSLVLLL